MILQTNQIPLANQRALERLLEHDGLDAKEGLNIMEQDKRSIWSRNGVLCCGGCERKKKCKKKRKMKRLKEQGRKKKKTK